ncbi:MAG TPA: sigma-54 dependent transcriptional regulator [Thiobacillaceae bacterium]|nr:sigma-54 dependent transcriptional regulator [Thiobacillaceae bacterium]HNU63259.1 sigma-54 dependent transcriptional regulator [Thiobacillaceae bacterium]
MADPQRITHLWQAAAQAVHWTDFLNRILAAPAGPAGVLVARLERDSRVLELEAGAGQDQVRRLTPTETAWARLIGLTAAARPWLGQAQALARRVPGLVPGDWRTPVALMGLAEGDCTGLVLVTGHHAGLAGLARDLAPPCAAFLARQMRWRTLASAREAAEAERRALLLRLKRGGLGDSIVGADTGLREVMEAVARVAPADTPVLILGETGTGKEVVARALHTHSRRTHGPFLRVNCGAIPPELIDSELFGHERGSFTGAVGSRKGWFERADGGTLFLDEVGELPPAAQVRLLRVLQDGSFQRVGGGHSLSVDVRLVAATNRDLRAAVAAGEFREDLWFRIAVFPIPLPPLRARAGDIPALAAHFSLRAAERLGLPPRMPDAADLGLLTAYPWPGNVRELASVIERAAILGNGQRLEVARSLGVYPGPTATAMPPPSTQVPASGEADASFRQPTPASLEEHTRAHIEAALGRCHGRVEGPFGAARLLRLNPNTLRSKMRRLGIEARDFRQSRTGC